jgi:hypothetical protein
VKNANIIEGYTLVTKAMIDLNDQGGEWSFHDL